MLLERREWAAMIGRDVPAHTRTIFFVLLAFDGAKLVELCHEFPAIIRNKYVERYELPDECFTDAAQQFVNTHTLSR